MSMRVITLNANGIRAAERKGLFAWLSRQRADFVCIQEIKAQPEQLSDRVFYPKAFECIYHGAQKKGYSGVALYTRHKPDEVIVGLGWPEIDEEGRYLEVRIGELSVISLYVPSGTSGDERQSFKMRFLAKFAQYLRTLASDGRRYIICGDWNIAHKAIDLKNWRSNQKNSGFLPEEREWMQQLFTDVGFSDAFRLINDRAEQYTWWSNRGQAWANNVGWRLDYQVISNNLCNAVAGERIHTRTRFSDHAPLIMDYDYAIGGQ